MPPLADAVRLVDREQRDVGAADQLAEALVVEALRRDVQQPQPACADVVAHGPVVVASQRRVQPPRGNAPRSQGVDLVFHQRDQRRNDQRQPGQHQGGQLVAERLAAAGRKDCGCGPPGQQMPHHFRLARLELREAEMPLQQRFQRLRFGGCCHDLLDCLSRIPNIPPWRQIAHRDPATTPTRAPL